MINDEIAVNKRTALKMYWDAGYTSELLMKIADESLGVLRQPSPGYYLAGDVSESIRDDEALIGVKVRLALREVAK